jgi:hypothetical protein
MTGDCSLTRIYERFYFGSAGRLSPIDSEFVQDCIVYWQRIELLRRGTRVM